MYTKQDYLNECKEYSYMREKVNKDPNRLAFHLMPPTGWLNDPNGLFQHQGRNHIYFQYTPFKASWGIKSWGHYTTKDWIHYVEEEPFLFPDIADDRDGAYSGSAFKKDDQVHFFYTGNVKLLDQEYDYITNGREQNTIHIQSPDGYQIDVKETVLKNEDYPTDLSKHVRDPKIYPVDGSYVMVLGARTLADTGCVICFKSHNLREWSYIGRIETDSPLGYMWECPDLFELSGQKVLSFCPQGLPAQKEKFQNVFQNGYVLLDGWLGDYDLSVFKEFDYGFDFYAPQTFLDDKGRRILIAWMGMPEESGYSNQPTIEYGWIHALTMPRELVYKDHHIYQKPLDEFKQLRLDEHHWELTSFTGWQTENSTFEMRIRFTENPKSFSVQLREGVKLSYKNNLLRLSLGKSGYGRNERVARIDNLSDLVIYSDTSAIEIFVNEGLFTMTSRVYSDFLGQKLSLDSNVDGLLSIYQLNGFDYH
ncbi:glycoside hydrolase family 32 protein [Streptococcus tangpeifui]|uniref:glycoside hydrolase family 32 protein n=1 Tax=Streptococcus tangpeifui TaxID=2709400 RepID=UPI0013EABDF6|nr:MULTISPECIES: glycoside hydrolase family 32 protein [unclassified Streptococcus]